MRLLKIDTSAPSSGQGTRRDGSQTPASATLSPFTTSRSRTISAASSASSISIISPALSSANVSSTSVNIIPRSTSSASTYTAQPHDYIPWSPTETIQDEHEEPDPDCVLAMHDFVPEAGKANTCLAFQAGQIIHVLNRDTSGWWDGKIDDGRRGWFPSNYVTATANLLTEEELPKAKVRSTRDNITYANISSRHSDLVTCILCPPCRLRLGLAPRHQNTILLQERTTGLLWPRH